jgi:O-antigen/teichoic acid export membrane protein
MFEETQQQETRSSVNKRIAKNTIALYGRMVFAMFVSLYTSRVVLQTLGVEDFGTYGVVGSIVVLFAFVNSTLVGSIQRFLNFEIGKNNPLGVTKVFSNGFHVQVIFAVIIIVLGETIGLYYLNNFMKIPEGRMYAANWVYQFAILTTVLRIIRSPFTASLIAYERMTVFAVVGVINVCLKLLIVYMLLISPFDRLITYAALGACVSAGMTMFYIHYNNTHFKYCRIQRGVEKPLLKQMLSFSGWSIFGSASLLATFQGVDLIINYFHGVAVNAALTIANQVYGAAYSLTSNFQTAFNPQITKTYAKGDMKELFDLICRTTRYSFFLVIICALPLFFECGGLLSFWLGTVPNYAKEFCDFMVLICVVDALSGPLWMSVYATGKIKKYQIIISSILFLNFPITAICMYAGMSPVWALVIRFLVTIGGYLYRLFYLITKMDLSIKYYIGSVVKPCGIVFILAVLIVSGLHYSVHLHTVPMTIILVIITCTVILTIGLNKNERLALKKAIVKKFSK